MFLYVVDFCLLKPGCIWYNGCDETKALLGADLGLDLSVADAALPPTQRPAREKQESVHRLVRLWYIASKNGGFNMNFIIIVSDTFRRDHLGCYGNEWISTPNLDRFAEKSIVFDRAYAASFPTVPNRHDLFTGRYTFTYAEWAPLPRDAVILAEELGKVGYASMMILDTPHITENGYYFDRGFTGWEWIRGQETDRWRTAPANPEYPCDRSKLRSPERIVKLHQRNVAWRRYEEDTFVARTMTAAGLWLQRNYGEHENTFLYVDTFDPHEPWDAPQWYVKMYDDPTYDGPDVSYPIYGPADYLTDAELKHCRALYAAEATLVDRWVGHLLERIEDMGLLEDTLVIFTTDHGFYHGEHGLIGKSHITPRESHSVPLYEEVARIPLIMYCPGATPRRESALVQPVDLMPTLLDLAGAPLPETTHGLSMAPLLRGEPMRTHEFAITSPTIIHHGAGGCRITLTTEEWALICAPSARESTETMDRAVDGHAKQVGEVRVSSELYHLPSDPRQQRNVIGQYPKVAADLRTRLVAFLESCDTSPEYIEPWR